MKNSTGSLKFRYTLFIISVVVTIAASMTIILYSLDQQNEDANLINVAGRQRMLSQRISKLTLFLYYAEENEALRKTYRFDSLRMHVANWKKMHYYLIDQNNEQRNSLAIARLLNENTPRLEKICNVCEMASDEPTAKNLKFAIDEIAKLERPFLLTMEKTVATYQREAEEKLSKVKKVVASLGILALVIFVLEFRFVFSRALFRLSESNHELQELNKQLSMSNSELMATEEEIRTNMEQIHLLKDHLELSERQYRELVNNATDMIYELNASGKFSFVNPIMESVTGFPQSEMLGMIYSQVVHEDDRNKVVQFYKNQMERREPVSYLELRIRTKSGRVMWVGQNAKMFFDDRWVNKVSVVARDITEIKEIEAQLTRERSLLRTIIDNIPANIYVKDLQSRKILANRTELEHMGVAREEDILGKSDWELYPENSALVSISEDKKVFEGEAIVNVETYNVLPGGKEKWFLISKIPLHDEANNVTGLVGISIDITETKKDKEALRLAKDQAEEATLAKSRFLGIMSHEIRTPLNGIMGLTGLLNENNPRPDQVENLKLLKFSCDNLLTIINDILDFNKIEAGKMELETIPFNLAETAAQYHKMLNVRATQKGIELKLKLDSNLPSYVMGDPVRLGQVLNNLIGNSIKFTEQGHVQISVTHLSKVGDSHRIRFSISDTGIGIPADKVDEVFSGFSQASRDTTRKFGGTGLGLSITKKLLELMNSKIEVRSELGRGSEFSFELEMKESQALLPEPESMLQSSAEVLHVLVVDDNRVNQIVASNFLFKWGHEVTCASSGDEALDLILKKRFDLILMDIQMPDKDGYETTMEIRRMPDKHFKEVPIVALTADILPEVKEKAFQSGMNDYLSKPFQQSDLQTIINKYVRKVAFKKSSAKSKIEEITLGDETYTKELMRHIAASLTELRNAFHETWNSRDAEPFKKAHHKSKTSLFILQNETLNNVVAKVVTRMKDDNYDGSDGLEKEVNDTFSEVIEGLS
ncbi:MAG TPA: PAS domain S-box protein [Cyclobacteriaceae bacterium]|jgi:PAS domain S-box-containing protein|nr:PAS domain S-box protein [Cyclobacteriaceae bacterium]